MAASGDGITEIPGHACCESMSDCPIQSSNPSGGLNSLLDSFSNANHSIDIFKSSVEQFQESSVSFVFPKESRMAALDYSNPLEGNSFYSSSPELFIRFETLLI